MLDSSNNMLQESFNNQQAVAVQDALDKERAENDRVFIAEHLEKGRSYLDKNQFTEALIEFNIALTRNPNQGTVLQAIQTTQRRLDEEISGLLQRSRREMQDENYSEALRLLADARLLGGDNPAVLQEIETLTQRIRLQDNIRKGLELYDLGEFNRALELFEEALQADPENNLVKQYYERSRIETSPDEQAMDAETTRKYYEGVELFLIGKYTEAIEIWKGILEEHPYNKKVLEAIRNAEERRDAK
jgi:tetratricopeptide (TPR) repeat protein